GYPVSVQGQAKLVRDVCAAANEAGAIGVFYWEGAWLPVKPESGTASSVWEEKGSGWASSYASDYDPDDAGKYYGGCSWENQALFDFDGKTLPSLDVFKYISVGAQGEVNDVLWYEDSIEVNINPGGEVVLPETVDCVWADPECTSGMKVAWDEDAVAAIDTDAVGEYLIPGSVELAGSGVALDPADLRFNDDGTLYVEALVNVANVNLVEDPSFEEEDHSVWKITDNAGNAPVDYQKKASDAHTGEVAVHFWSQSDMDFCIEQEVKPGQAGKYSAEAYMQGGDFDASSTIELYVVVGDTEYTSDPVSLDGWVNWKNPRIEDIEVGADDTVTVGARVRCNALAWATFDDFSLNLQ
ncbi:MAG: glycosyl hydrolase 53 family protein, partial [Lachnospiraceae bacterium]|nr:glycosyl hydrolase 53 family protein [Lachnospiraceae bacterium]